MSSDLPPIDWEKLEREIFASERERARLRDLARAKSFSRESDEIVDMILRADMPRIDVENRIRAFRSRVLKEFPRKRELFDAIYLARFERIWSQFRTGEGLFENRK